MKVKDAKDISSRKSSKSSSYGESHELLCSLFFLITKKGKMKWCINRLPGRTWEDELLWS